MSSNINNINVTNSTCYKKFIASVVPEEMEIRSITVRDSVLGGRFNWLSAEVHNKMSGKVNPTFIFLRGDAVAILAFIHNSDTNQKFIIVTEQLRAPTGGYRLEAIAGMMDDAGSASGQAVQELQEETGIKINDEQLKFLGSYYSSQGIMDEKIQCFYFTKSMTSSEIEEMTTKMYGEGDFEAIRLRLINADWNSVISTQDAKLISSYSMYCNEMSKVSTSVSSSVPSIIDSNVSSNSNLSSDASNKRMKTASPVEEDENIRIIRNASKNSKTTQDFADNLMKGMMDAIGDKPMTYAEMRARFG